MILFIMIWLRHLSSSFIIYNHSNRCSDNLFSLSLCHFVTFVTLSLCHSVTLSLCHFVTLSLCQLCHFVTLSLCHSVTLSLLSTFSLCHFFHYYYHEKPTPFASFEKLGYFLRNPEYPVDENDLSATHVADQIGLPHGQVVQNAGCPGRQNRRSPHVQFPAAAILI